MAEIQRRALLTGLGGLVIPGIANAGAKAAMVGQPAPAFDVFTFDFKKIHFKEMRGKVVLLNYWATWCGPCRMELPILSDYYTRNTDRGLMMFAVKGDDSAGESRPNAALMAWAKLVAFPMVWHLTGDGYGPIGDSFPTNYVIGRDGVLRYAEAGAFEAGSVDAVLGPLLKEPAPAA